MLVLRTCALIALCAAGAILTKMDGDSRGGAALSVKAVSGKPIKFVGTGEKLEALEPFYPDRIASRILGDNLSAMSSHRHHSCADCDVLVFINFWPGPFLDPLISYSLALEKPPDGVLSRGLSALPDQSLFLIEQTLTAAGKACANIERWWWTFGWWTFVQYQM